MTLHVKDFRETQAPRLAVHRCGQDFVISHRLFLTWTFTSSHVMYRYALEK
jgi:hypothetical protein